MLIIPKVKEYMKPKTRDEQRTDIIKKLLKDQDGPSQLGEMNDKKFKRLKDDKDKKGKMAHSEKVYRTREDEKNQIVFSIIIFQEYFHTLPLLKTF